LYILVIHRFYQYFLPIFTCFLLDLTPLVAYDTMILIPINKRTSLSGSVRFARINILS